MKRSGYKEAYEALEPEFAIYSALIEARIKGNLTQKQLAKKIGISQPALNRLECGRVCKIMETFQKLLKITDYKIKIVPA
jgi:transcriptional regulator with XRE-family HTH domain